MCLLKIFQFYPSHISFDTQKVSKPRTEISSQKCLLGVFEEHGSVWIFKYLPMFVRCLCCLCWQLLIETSTTFSVGGGAREYTCHKIITKRNRPKSWQWKQKQWKPIKGQSSAKNGSKVPNCVTTLNPYKSGLEWTFEALPVPKIISWEFSSCGKRTWVNCTSVGWVMALQRG